MSQEGKKQCQHSGCEAYYVEEENNETSCQYHPGAPIFHEGLNLIFFFFLKLFVLRNRI